AARRGRVLRLALVVALLTAFYPAGLAFYLLAVVALVVAAPLAGGVAFAGRALRAAGGASGLGVVGLVPLPAAVPATHRCPGALAYASTHVDGGALGFVVRAHLDLVTVLRFQTGPAGAGFVVWGLVVSAAVALFVATGERLAWVARGWVLALVGYGIVWIPAR